MPACASNSANAEAYADCAAHCELDARQKRKYLPFAATEENQGFPVLFPFLTIRYTLCAVIFGPRISGPLQPREDSFVINIGDAALKLKHGTD